MGKNKMERQGAYKSMVISDPVLEAYDKKAWGSATQIYNEYKKIKYNLAKKSRKTINDK